MYTPFILRNRGCHSKNLLPKRNAACLCHFPKAPILTPVRIQFIKNKKSAVLGACICKPLSYLVTGETAQDAEPDLFPGLHCQGQPKENRRHNQLNPLIFQPRWPCEPTILEAVDLQLGLQLPQNTRPLVCVLSTTLSLFGNKPWCNPLEMTKEIKDQM